MSKRSQHRLSYSVVDQCGVRGRPKELATLKKLYHDCAQVSKVLIVEGKPGVGKTALVTSQPQLRTLGHFVSGTFDPHRTAEPFSAMVDALHELFDELLSEDYCADENSAVKDIMDQFAAESKNDAGMRNVLQNAFPLFADLLQAKRDETRLQQEAFDTSVHNSSFHKKSKIKRPAKPRPSRTASGYKKGWNFEKLKISLRLLLRCICSPQRRVVLFLDDLQYADPSSLELIEFLASGDGLSPVPSVDEDDNRVKGLLLILAYRNVSHDGTQGSAIAIDHPFRARLKELKLMKCPIHRIHVKDLNLEAINDIVAHVTRHSDRPQDTMPLSQVVYKKTGGNPLGVLHMLEYLEHEKLLYFNLGEYQWEWKNVRTIHSATDLSDNIVDLAALKLQVLPHATQQILMVAACIGTYFRVEVVAAYFRKHNAEHHQKIDFEAAVAQTIRDKEEGEEKKDGTTPNNNNNNNVEDSSSGRIKTNNTLLDRMIQLLELPLKQDLLTKRRKSTTYFFAHERLQTAAYNLLPPEEKTRKALHWRLGQLMKHKSQQFPQEHWMAYLATDQLNRGLIFLSDSSERVELAQMNLQIALMSQEKSAFCPAAEFLRSAIRLLFHDDFRQERQQASNNEGNENLYNCGPAQYKAVWKSFYDLCLDLFSSLAEMEYLLGNHRASKQAVDEVLKNASSEEDKFRAQVILIESISAQRKFDTAIETCLKILSVAHDMKLSSSPMKLQIMNEKSKVNKMLEQQIQFDDKSEHSGSLTSADNGMNSSLESQPALPTIKRKTRRPIARTRSDVTGIIKPSFPSSGTRSPPSRTRSGIKPSFPSSRTRSTGRPPTGTMPKNESRFKRVGSSDGSKFTNFFIKKQEQAMMTLPKMTDDNNIRISKLLSQLMLNAIWSGKTDLSAYIGLRSIRFSFQHGISPHSPMALAAYGISQAKEGKYNEAFANGMLALKLLDIAESKEWYTRTILKCHNLRHIKKPFHESLDPMMEGYRTGIGSGDMEYALVAAMHYALLYMFVGLPLGPLEPDLMAFAEQVHRYHLPFVLEVTFYIYREYILDLQGEQHDKISLADNDESNRIGNGSIRSASSATGTNTAIHIDKRVRPLVEREMCIVNMQKYYLFGQYEEAEKMMNQLNELPKFDYSVLRTVNRDAFFGLINLALAKTTGRKRYRERARKIIEEFETYVKHGSVNSHHILMLLLAEEASVNASDWGNVLKAYDEAIKVAGRAGFTNHEAMANERAGSFLLELQKTNKKVQSDSTVTRQAKDYISRAMALYKEWGAEAKVEQMEQQFPEMQPSALMQGSNCKARRRFSRTLTARFRDMKLHSGRWSVGASSDLKILDGFDDLKKAPRGGKIDPYGFAGGSKLSVFN